MAQGLDLSRYLLLPEMKLRQVRSGPGGFLIEVVKIRPEFEICPHCAKPTSISYGRRWVQVRDEPWRSRQVTLKIQKRRYYCKPCRRTFMEPVPGIWPKRRTTQRFRQALRFACSRYSNLSQVRRDFKCSSSLVYNAYYEQLAVKLKEYQPPWPKAVGVDEHFFSRAPGYTQFTTVFADLTKSRLREAVLGKDKKTVMAQVSHIKGREQVKWAVIDMSDTYRSLVRELFPAARIVADKFHVLRLASPLLLKERKQIAGFKKDLPTRRLLLTSRERLEYWQCDKIDRYLADKNKLRELYWFKERLHTFYRTKQPRVASRSIDDLIARAKGSEFEELHRLGRTLHRWRTEILNYFESRLTNARTEAFNNTGKLVMKRAYGYKNHKNYRLRLLSACLR